MFQKGMILRIFGPERDRKRESKKRVEKIT
jgi:hypothetical protein